MPILGLIAELFGVDGAAVNSGCHSIVDGIGSYRRVQRRVGLIARCYAYGHSCAHLIQIAGSYVVHDSRSLGSCAYAIIQHLRLNIIMHVIDCHRRAGAGGGRSYFYRHTACNLYILIVGSIIDHGITTGDSVFFHMRLYGAVHIIGGATARQINGHTATASAHIKSQG